MLIFLGAILSSFAVFLLLRAYFRRMNVVSDAVKLLLQDATKFKWIKIAEIRTDGEAAAWTLRSARFVRGRQRITILYKTENIILVRPYASPEFEDFNDLEKWIAAHPRTIEEDYAGGERLYLRKIDEFITMHGHNMDYLHVTATDEAFLIATLNLQRTGYARGEDAEIVAALTLDALNRYKKDRGDALRFVSYFQKEFSARHPEG